MYTYMHTQKLGYNSKVSWSTRLWALHWMHGASRGAEGGPREEAEAQSCGSRASRLTLKRAPRARDRLFWIPDEFDDRRERGSSRETPAALSRGGSGLLPSSLSPPSLLSLRSRCAFVIITMNENFRCRRPGAARDFSATIIHSTHARSAPPGATYE